ncbi:DUF885 family protein [Sphingobium aquiterrae]|uniref:DUF885 family protein n=1 Tax=Sphingobium aquiterrae TaxID=2038656 RepID=UPI0030196BF9
MNRREAIKTVAGAALAGSMAGSMAGRIAAQPPAKGHDHAQPPTWDDKDAQRPKGSHDDALRRLLDRLAGADDPAEGVEALAAFDPATLSPYARLDRDAVLAGRRMDAQIGKGWPYGIVGETPYAVSPVAGAWRRAGTGASADAATIDRETDRLRADAAQGVRLPRPLLDQTIAAVLGAAVLGAAVSGAAADAGAHGAGPAADALRRQAAALSALREASPAEPGVWQLPRGDAYYAAMLRRQCGGAITPAQAHRRFLKEAEALSRRADSLMRGMGMDRGTVGDRFRTLSDDPRWLYSDDDAGRDTAVADMNRWLDRSRARLPALLGPVPGDMAAIRVLRMTPADEARGRSGYRRLPGGTQAGAYFVDLKDIRRRPSWTLPGVVHHELLPGHLAQAAFAALAPAHPLRERYAPGFSEGWAIYAERLMAADGAFASDPRAELGHLHWMMFRICRALVDTGVHYRRWSLSEARTTVAALQGNAVAFAPMERDMERICMAPGNRAAEALTWLGIADLRAGAGGRMIPFHATLLRNGPVPLAFLAGDPGM